MYFFNGCNARQCFLEAVEVHIAEVIRCGKCLQLSRRNFPVNYIAHFFGDDQYLMNGDTPLVSDPITRLAPPSDRG